MRYLVFLFLGFGFWGAAQNRSVEPVTLNFHQFTVKEKLTESTNWFVNTDSDGFTWVGSMGGANVFDGVNNQPVRDALQGLNIQSSFLEDHRGDIWFTTEQAIHRYQKEKNRFTSDFIGGTAGMHYAFYLDREQDLWVIAQGKLFKYATQDTGQNRTHEIAKDFQVARAAVDTSADGKVAAVYGCYWMYGIGKGFEVIEFRDGLNPEKYTWSDIRREPADEITTRQVIALEGSEACFLTDKGLLFLDRNDRYNYYLVPFPKEIGLVNHMVKVGNRLLLVNQSEKIYQFDLTPDRRAFLPEEIRAYNLDEQAYIHNMKRIFLGRDSILWVSVEGRGVYYANLKNTRTFSVFRGDSMPPIPIEHIFEDFHGRIWSVSREKKNDAFRAWAFDMDNRLQDSTWLPGYFKAVQLPGGDVWAISTRGLGYQSKTGHQFNWLASLPELQSFPLYDIVTFDKAQLLLATEEGIYRYHTITGKLSRLKGVDGYVWKIFMDTRNRLWVNKSTGILTIWQFDPEKDDLNGLDTIRNVYGLNHMVEDTLRDVFWIATSRGLKKISDLTDHLHDNTDSFFEDDIRSVLIDPGHKLWLTTNRGVVRFDPDAERGEPITRFTDRDGISALEYTNGAALMARSGKLYFGSSGGMDCFDPGIDLIGAVPKLAIRNLFINNNTNEEWRDENGYPINRKKTIDLKYWQNTLTFDLAALEYSDPIRNRIKVWLYGRERIDSTTVGPDLRLTYTDLQPGVYTFEFAACNSEGIWPTLNGRRRLRIKIHPPWYQTVWFKVLAVILIIALVGLITSFYFSYQLKAKEAEVERQKRLAERAEQKRIRARDLQDERDRIANAMHDDLNGSLSTIINASTQSMWKEKPDEWRETLSMVSRRSARLAERLRDVIWAIDPANDSLKELLAKIRADTATFLDDNKISAIINTPEQIPDLTVTSKVRNNLNFTVKELLHNILKYAKANQVEFTISLTDVLHIAVADNGVGFDVEALDLTPKPGERKRRGVGNCIDRITSINGRIRWARRSTGGTLVTIDLDKEHLL